jgi:hypothetical protein
MMDEVYVYSIFPSAKFKRTRKLAEKQGLDMDLLDWAINQLAQALPLPSNWKAELTRPVQYFVSAEKICPCAWSNVKQYDGTLPPSS